MKQNRFRILLSCLLMLCLVCVLPGRVQAAGGAYIEGEKLRLDSPAVLAQEDVSYIFPNAGAEESRWVKGTTIRIPFFEYSRGEGAGSADETMRIFIYDSESVLRASYVGGFSKEQGHYQWNLRIEDSEYFAPGAYYLRYYSTNDQGNKDSDMLVFYVVEYDAKTQYNEILPKEGFAGSRHEIGSLSRIPYTLYSLGYGGQTYTAELYDAEKTLLKDLTGKFPLDRAAEDGYLELDAPLEEGIYYLRTYATYTPQERKDAYHKFYVGDAGVRWSFDESTGTLTVFGKGTMDPFENGTAPWAEVVPGITRVVIGEGVLTVEDNAFSGCTGLTEVSFLGDAPQIAPNAFAGVTARCTYPIRNTTWNGENKAQYGGTLTWEAEVGYLDKVTMKQALPHVTGNIIYWEEVEYAQLYQLFRRAADETTWTLIKNTGSLAYKDESAEVGVKYYYKVRARLGDLMGSLDIPAVSAIRPAPPVTKLDNVTITSILPHVTGNIVYWNAVENANVYQVYRLRSGETSWTLLKNTGSLAYKDESAEVGVKYYYKIVARFGELKSDIATTASASAVRPAPPITSLDAVVMDKAVGHATGNIVYWNAVENAKLYQVYRRAADETSWTLLTNTGSLAYKDTSALSGVKYYYKVVARNGDIRSTMNIPAVSAIRP